jgi:hypothetical protein
MPSDEIKQVLSVLAQVQTSAARTDQRTFGARLSASSSPQIARGRVSEATGTPGSVPLGNAVAGNVGKGGPGTGRKLYGKSGSQCQTGPANPGLGRITNTKGQWPD